LALIGAIYWDSLISLSPICLFLTGGFFLLFDISRQNAGPYMSFIKAPDAIAQSAIVSSLAVL
jgi:hypothetical protein